MRGPQRSATKQRLIELVDALPDSEVIAAERFLEYLRDRGADPLLKALEAAPEDDEPVSSEDLEAIREADEAVARGQESPWEEVRQRLPGVEPWPGS